MSDQPTDESAAFTSPFQLTKTVHRKVYPAVSPDNPANAQPGKIILITGAGTGIGAAAARVWVRAGAAGVVIAGRRQNVLDETARELRGLAKDLGKDTKLFAVSADMTVYEQVKNLFEQTKWHFGGKVPDVVVANAGIVNDPKPLAEVDTDAWWSVLEINLRGVHNTVAAFIRSQDDPKNPSGTIININSGLAGLVNPGLSAYSISKLAVHRYMEYVGKEYPTLRAFTLLPGIVETPLTPDLYRAYAQDDAELTGGWALYLAQQKADYLKGSLTSVNWDIEEMEARKVDIVEKGMLQIRWVSVLPSSGGSGF